MSEEDAISEFFDGLLEDEEEKKIMYLIISDKDQKQIVDCLLRDKESQK